MAADPRLGLITAGDLTKDNVPLANIRRYGRQLFPEAADWGNLDRKSEVPPAAALGAVIVRHLMDRHILAESDALSVVLFFKDDVARYAEALEEEVRKLRLAGHKDEMSLPVVMLEVLDGRWIRLGGKSRLFDVQEQVETLMEKLHSAQITWSHSVCLLPLFLRVCPLEKPDGHQHDKQTASAGEAE